MEKFIGSWALEKNENFVEYLRCLGAPYMISKLVNLLPVTVNIRQEADEYTIENVTTLKKTKARFKLDEPFEETSMGDTTFKSLIRLENGELHYQQRGKKEINGTWSVDGETLNVVIKVEDIVCRRTYKRVE
ncbi:hypothetical protein AAHC03_09161 [Spirometra sp. Aus1]